MKKAAFALMLALCLVGIIGGFLTSIVYMMRSSDAYQIAMETISAEPRVMDAIGNDLKPGFWTNGSVKIETGGTGEAKLSIPVYGNKGSGTVTAHAVRFGGRWDMRLLVVIVDGVKAPLVLINADNQHIPGAPAQTALRPAPANEEQLAATLRATRAAAERGDAAAQFNLGVMYEEGRAISQDNVEAVAWYRKAADQGYGPAQINLGMMYGTGQGVEKDDVQAAAWYRKAADQGNAPAQSNLGVMYRDGRGVAQDDAQAVAWLRKAADQGDDLAKGNLRQMLEQGRGSAKQPQ